MAAKKKLSVADRIVEGLEEFADALEDGVDVAENFNCHKVVLVLEPQAYDPEKVQATRQMLRASQAIFAQFLGVATQAVQSWEQGNKQPSNMACRFMDEIRGNPEYWRGRLRQCVQPKTPA